MEVERVHEWRRDPRVIAAVAAAVLLAGAVAWFRSSTASSPPAAASAVAPPGATTTTTTATVVVHVVGAVRAPGVVPLPASARVVDAIAAAGGVVADADLARLNLAAHVTDGQRIAVPHVGEVLAPVPGDVDVEDGEASGPTNLNTATQAQLEALPGIGPTLAQAILDERERSGGFKSVEDLQKVRGIGPARFEQLRELVTV